MAATDILKRALLLGSEADKAYAPYEMETKAADAYEAAMVRGSLGKDPKWNVARWSTEKAISDGYEASEWVRICIDRIAQPASTVPWRVSTFASDRAKANYEYERKSVPLSEMSDFHRSIKAKELRPAPGHPLEMLLEGGGTVEPYFSRQELIERITQHLLLGGNGLWKKVRAGGVPVELFPLGPDLTRPVPAEQRGKLISHYERKLGTKDRRRREPDVEKIPVEDVIHVMLPDPSNLLWGCSPLMAAARVVDTDVEAINWNKVSLQNRAVYDTVVTFNKNLSVQEWQEARRQLREQHQGAKSAYSPWVLGNDAKVDRVSLTPVEMDFILGRKMNRESICGIFGVPLPVAGILSDTSQANPDVYWKQHWISTVLPYLDRLMAVLNRSLAREFGKNVLLWYDTSNVDALRENFHEKVRSSKQLWSEGVPFDIINQYLRMGFPEHIPGGEMGYYPASVLSHREIQLRIQAMEAGIKTQEEQGDAGGGNTEAPPDGGETVGEVQGGEVRSPQGEGELPSSESGEKGARSASLQRKRWGMAEITSVLERHGIRRGRVDNDGDNHYLIFPASEGDEEKVANLYDEIEGEDGVEWDEPNGTLRFYNGNADAELAEYIARKEREWGFTQEK